MKSRGDSFDDHIGANDGYDQSHYLSNHYDYVIAQPFYDKLTHIKSQVGDIAH